jgi:adenine phosphoribosyltransferase
MPNSIVGKQYSKEYKSDTSGGDQLSISEHLIGDRYKKVLIIDDLAATGGTMLAAIDLVNDCGGIVVECACIIELVFLDAVSKIAEKKTRLWSLIRV